MKNVRCSDKEATGRAFTSRQEQVLIEVTHGLSILIGLAEVTSYTLEFCIYS